MNVFIVDDHPLFVAGIRALLEAEADITIIGEAGNGREAVEKIRKKTPDVVIMDISMPDMDGIEATHQILKEQNDIKIIALSIHTGKRYIKEMLDAGATGYLVKDSAPEELVQALKKVARGEMYLSSAITSIALEKDDTGAEEMRDTDSSILRTKLHRPSISDDIVIRTGIIQHLEENKSRPLTLVSAGAGYGKSIAVSQWLESTTSQHSWLTLDEEHNDLRIFLTYFISAVERIFPSQLRETSSLIQTAELPSLPVISQILINELDGIDQEFILVLDDYHRIEQESIHNLLDELLHFPPENVNLTLISRRDPPLRLSNLRAHGRINEIRIDQLCFTTFEINSLFKNLYGMELDDRLAESVLKKTEGWIAGLRLTALLVSNADDMERLLASMKGDSRLVSEFLVEEVLLKQPVHIQDYLMSISVFDSFCADLIDAVNLSDIADQREKISGVDFIELLVKSNLFIVPLDDQNEWYRYHHLFQELLLRRLKDNRNGKEIAELHLRASDWFVGRGLIDNAIRHTLAAQDPVKAAEIIEQHRHAELNRDRWYVVLRWLDMIPDEIKQQRIALMLTHVFLLFEQFRLLEMIPVLEQIDTMLSKDATDPGLRAEAKFCHAYILIYLNGDGEAALKLLQEAKEEIPENYEMIRAEIELCLAVARQMSGHGEEAIKSLEKKIRTENSPGGMIYSRLLTGLVFLYLHMGNLELANAAAKRLEIFAEQENLAYIRVFAQYAKANISLNSFDLEGAVKGFLSAVEGKSIVNAKIAVDIMSGLGISHQLMGQTDQATNVIDRLIEFSQEAGESGHIDVAESCNARLSFMRGEPAMGLEWARSYDAETHVPSMNFWLEIPVITQTRILILAGTNDDVVRALGLLDSLVKGIDKLHNTYQKIEILVLQSVALDKLERTTEAQTFLEEAVNKAQPGNWIRPFVEAGPTMPDMLKRLEAKDITGEYIEKLINAIANYKDIPEGRDQIKSFVEPDKVLAAVPGGENEFLTAREMDVLTLLAKGNRNKEIAAELFISTETIKRHLSNIFQKLNVHSRMQVISKSKELGIIE